MGKKDKSQPNGTEFENEGKEHENQPFDLDQELADDDVGSGDEGGQEGKVEELQRGLSELRDKQLRLLAEFDNYKKRTMRERLELLNSASKDVLVKLLPVLDDFDRAKKSAADPNTGEQLSEGVLLVYNRLHSALQSMGLKAMESTGQPFDPEWHEAITEIPSPNETMKGKIIDTIEKGYLLNDKIIRHAKVVVGN